MRLCIVFFKNFHIQYDFSIKKRQKWVMWRHVTFFGVIWRQLVRYSQNLAKWWYNPLWCLWQNVEFFGQIEKKVMAVEIRVLKTALWPQICPFWAISGRSIWLTQVESTDSIWFTDIIKDILRGMFQKLASYSLLGLLWEGFYAYKTPKTPNCRF